MLGDALAVNPHNRFIINRAEIQHDALAFAPKIIWNLKCAAIPHDIMKRSVIDA